MTIFDSNVWVAYFHEQDSQHQKALKAIDAVTSTVLLPEYVLLEVCTILSQHAGKESADTFIDFASSNRDVRLFPVESALFFDLMGFYRDSPHRHLSFVDVSLLWLSRSYEVITFDTYLQKAILVHNGG